MNAQTPATSFTPPDASAVTDKAVTQTGTVHHLIPEDFARYTEIALLDEVRVLMAQERALQYRLAAVLRELDGRDQIDGRPMRLTRWLHDVFGLTFGTAREKVRTARALGSLPAIDTAFRDGRLSYSKVRALTRVATSENEDELLRMALKTSAEGVEQLVRRVKQDECIEYVQALIRSRSVSTRWDESGALIVQGRLTPEQGAVFLEALAKATEVQPAGIDDAYWARRADALTQIMADSLAGQPASASGDRHQVVVHVAAERLADCVSAGTSADGVSAATPNESVSPGTPNGKVSGGTPSEDVSAGTPEDVSAARPALGVSAGTPSENVAAGTLTKTVAAETFLHPETVRRLACDGGLVTVLEDPAGDPLNVGRKTRAIPPSTRRALVSRDRCCQFPGCSHDRYVEGHHIVHWARGGETTLDNLVLLCSHHHRAVHEMGYRLRRTSDGVELFRECKDPF